jgi:hypothetical protein
MVLFTSSCGLAMLPSVSALSIIQRLNDGFHGIYRSILFCYNVECVTDQPLIFFHRPLIFIFNSFNFKSNLSIYFFLIFGHSFFD